MTICSFSSDNMTPIYYWLKTNTNIEKNLNSEFRKAVRNIKDETILNLLQDSSNSYSEKLMKTHIALTYDMLFTVSKKIQN